MANLVNVNGTILNFDNLEYINPTAPNAEDDLFTLNFVMSSGRTVIVKFDSEQGMNTYLSELLDINPSNEQVQEQEQQVGEEAE